MFDLHERSELLALTYFVGGVAVVIAWIVDPADVSNRPAMAGLLTFVFLSAVLIYGLRNRLPAYTGDVAIVGSLVLIDMGMFFTNLHSYPGLLGPFYIWVGFASPLWFPRPRAVAYATLAVVASGVVTAVAGTAAVLAGWAITMATLIVAFCITSFLTDALVKREKLAILGEMASAVGHDLRNPLGALSNAVFLLRHSLGGAITEEQERQLRMGEREIEKADAIVRQLGDYVRPSQPRVTPTALQTLVNEVLETTPPPPGIAVSLRIPPLCLRVDNIQFAQVLTNLVGNAYDAMNGNGTLQICAEVHGRFVEIEVVDNGPGIDHALAERVFEPFYSNKHQGTGLGLAIVRRLIEAHGGTVGLDSASKPGSRFVIRLPARSLVT